MNLVNYSNYSKTILNFLIFIFPITFIIGNAAINLFILLISVVGIFLYKIEVFKPKKNFYLISIVCFFLFVIISTLIDVLQNSNNTNLFRSVLYLRYLVFLLVLNCMVEKNDFNFKIFSLSCLIFAGIVSFSVLFDGIAQIISLINIERSGHVPFPQIHSSSFLFGGELISGGYIQRFACIGIFFIPFFMKEKKNTFLIYMSCAIAIFSASIILSGNRMPFLLFIIFLFLGVILAKGIRKAFLSGLFLSLLVFLSILTFQRDHYLNWNSFYTNVVRSIIPGSKYFILDEVNKDYSDLKEEMSKNKKVDQLKNERFDYSYWKEKNYKGIRIIPFGTGHRVIWTTAIETWLEKPFIGSGIKSFRETCKKRIVLPNRTCESHTHNYYLEVLNDTGAFGAIFIFLSLYILLIKKFIEYYSKNKKNIFGDFIFYALFFSIILEFFPIRSSGNFFSTYNSAFIFLIVGLFLNFKNFSKSKI